MSIKNNKQNCSAKKTPTTAIQAVLNSFTWTVDETARDDLAHLDPRLQENPKSTVSHETAMGLHPAGSGAWVAGRIKEETKTLLGLIMCPA